MMALRAKETAEADRTALEALGADGRLLKLGHYVPALSLARAFGVSRDEVAHSRVLAELLDPACHAAAAKILGSLLREVGRRVHQAAEGESDYKVAEALEKLADGPFERIGVRRESMLIDVVVEVSGPGSEAVIGIENKIDAGEQPDQIGRYQATLARAYPGRAAVVVFLTPTGRAPATATEESTVPSVALGYGWLARTLSEARQEVPAGGSSQNASAGRDRRVLLELEEHVREEILGEGEAWRGSCGASTGERSSWRCSSDPGLERPRRRAGRPWRARA